MSIGKIRLSITIIALGLTGQAAALGFGEFRANVLLGQPLNLAVPLTLADGETLTSDCASADVVSGDSRLPPGTVRVRVTQGRGNNEAVLRISSTVAIDEPVVNVTLSVGCPTRITRALVLLADPPMVDVANVAAAGTTEPQAAPRSAPAPQGAVVEGAVNPARAAATPSGRATRPAEPRRATRTAAPRSTPPTADTATAAATQPAPVRRRRPSASAPPPPPVVAERPRLQLDGGTVASPAPAAPAVLAAEQQASAAREAAVVAEAAASAAQQRLKDVEAEMARLRADSKAQTDALIELRKQLAQDRNRPSEAGWLLPLLLGLVAALGAGVIWLAWRLRQEQQMRVNQRDAWYERSPGVAVSPSVQPSEHDSDYPGAVPSRIPSTLPPPMPSTASKGGPASGRPPLSPPSMFDTRAGGLDSMISPPTMPAHTAVTLPVSSARAADDALGSVSVDEQIDLEQQADFFIALGHDESAIDLLMAHLRSTGGGTPLPFLKLLEIHRRRGDRDAYERTRVRFNQRFNSVAPDWQADPKSGRTLEDYPLVVGRIQTAWPTPLDAMAELEALLFRRGVGSELFELPAYQEVLFLYQLARDLHLLSTPDSSNDVDVLLPIMTAPMPLAEGSISLRPEFNSGQSVTLDLDLGGERSAQADKPMLELDLSADFELPDDSERSSTGSKRDA
jgi:pilus assembly protein FimV